MSRLLVVLCLGSWCAPAVADDLAKVDRTIAKEPRYETKEPRYCLMVFGPEAKHRVWLVHDGVKLYVDRNGNGDLTEAGECVAAKVGEYTDPKASTFNFEEAGEVREGMLLHRQLSLYVHKLDQLAESVPGVREYLRQQPDALAYRLGLEVEMPGHKGSSPGGRVGQLVQYRDVHGFFRFGDSPRTAPVVHFRGPWQITLDGPEQFKVDRDRDLMLVLGTAGVGPGTRVCTAYEKVVPAGVNPQVEVTAPAKEPSSSPIRQLFELKERC